MKTLKISYIRQNISKIVRVYLRSLLFLLEENGYKLRINFEKEDPWRWFFYTVSIYIRIYCKNTVIRIRKLEWEQMWCDRDWALYTFDQGLTWLDIVTNGKIRSWFVTGALRNGSKRFLNNLIIDMCVYVCVRILSMYGSVLFGCTAALVQ